MKKKDKVTLICINCNSPFLCHEWVAKVRKFCTENCAHIYNGRAGKSGGNLSSLDKFIARYGIEEGTKRYYDKNRKISERVSTIRGKDHHNYGKKTPFAIKEKMMIGLKEYQKSIKGKTFDEINGDGASEKLSQRMKGVFSLQWFIDRHGEEIGNEKYKERCDSIANQRSFRNYNKTNKNNYSKVSQMLFWKIYSQLPRLKNEKVYFAELNHECSCGLRSYNFDFVIIDRKKVIEFNGDIFHANPNAFTESDCPNPYSKTLTAKEIWTRDESKINAVSLKGYDVLIVWESEYNKNNDGIIKKCIDFLEIV